MFQRSNKNPILKPIKNSPWQSTMVYNPGAIYIASTYYLFYRAIGKAWVSKIGLTTSQDGINFVAGKKPLLAPSLDIEKNGPTNSKN